MASVAILGATGSIGSVLARRLTAAGRGLLLVGRNAETLGALAQELAQPYVVVDMRSSQALADELGANSDRCGGYDGLVNCIGSLLLKPAHLTGDDEFRDVLETNLFTSFAAIRAGSKALRDHGGSIVLITSAAAEIGIANHEAIAAAKAGVVGLVRSAAATYAHQNIRVNAISPGLVRTELTRNLWENPASAAAAARLHALGRLGEPEQVASLADWLLAPKNDWMTGQVIGLDGGLSRVQPRARPAK
jgi:NAD(P)-dependent dehydrogenase (short-subunit alcohol dehydrogenase family)